MFVEYEPDTVPGKEERSRLHLFPERPYHPVGHKGGACPGCFDDLKNNDIARNWGCL